MLKMEKSEIQPQRKRGRPRKSSMFPTVEPAQKRPRGRPRKSVDVDLPDDELYYETSSLDVIPARNQFQAVNHFVTHAPRGPGRPPMPIVEEPIESQSLYEESTADRFARDESFESDSVLGEPLTREQVVAKRPRGRPRKVIAPPEPAKYDSASGDDSLMEMGMGDDTIIVNQPRERLQKYHFDHPLDRYLQDLQNDGGQGNIASHQEPVVKRPPGRPRKHPIDVQIKEKRPPGRPRKSVSTDFADTTPAKQPGRPGRPRKYANEAEKKESARIRAREKYYAKNESPGGQEDHTIEDNAVSEPPTTTITETPAVATSLDQDMLDIHEDDPTEEHESAAAHDTGQLTYEELQRDVVTLKQAFAIVQLRLENQDAEIKRLSTALIDLSNASKTPAWRLNRNLDAIDSDSDLDDSEDLDVIRHNATDSEDLDLIPPSNNTHESSTLRADGLANANGVVDPNPPTAAQIGSAHARIAAERPNPEDDPVDLSRSIRPLSANAQTIWNLLADRYDSDNHGTGPHRLASLSGLNLKATVRAINELIVHKRARHDGSVMKLIQSIP